jgi:hypothetical protein
VALSELVLFKSLALYVPGVAICQFCLFEAVISIESRVHLSVL